MEETEQKPDLKKDETLGSDKKYNWKEVEPRWQKAWKDWNIWNFDFNDNVKPVFSIDTPPPYASGGLHMGRATAYTLIDFVGRYKRLRGYNVLFPLCVDVNGMPIEIRVEMTHNITKKSVDRHEFIRMCSEFANENINQMMREFEVMGESMDPSIFYRTDAQYYRRLTQISFIKMHNMGLIYKGEAPVNWCPRCITAMADAEVEYKPQKTKLNYIKFNVENRDDYVIIATTRPELLCVCQMVAINPNDDTKNDLAGIKVKTPLFDKTVEIFEDENVDPKFGSGIVMICTTGDKDDLAWVYKYKLTLEKGIDEEGKMTAISGKYNGLPVAEAREKIIEDIKAAGLLVKQEEIEHDVGTCWRCHTPIEFLQVKQWFLKTRIYKEEMLKMANELKWAPEFMKVRLIDWINSLQWDWVLSRQRYFATPIPVWECAQCETVVLAKEDQCYVDPTKDKPPVDKCPKCGGVLKGCEDVFDTWMDSSISPLYNTFWMRDDAKFARLYPMTLRPQAHDIIRSWAYYTILRCFLITNKKPWSDIMIHGFIMAPDGKPMHTSLGNTIAPMPVLDEYGADAFRYYAATTSLGEDHAYIHKEVVHGTRFVNKFWNIQMFIDSYLSKHKLPDNAAPKEPANIKASDKWILSKYSKLVTSITGKMDNYLFDQALKELESFIWHELADHYIEMVKYRLKNENDESLVYTLSTIGLGITKLIAPIIPHVTEEVFNKYYYSIDSSKSLHISKWPEPVLTDDATEQNGENAKYIISEIRTWKSSNGMPLNAPIGAVTIVGKPGAINFFEDDIKSTIKARDLIFTDKSDIQEIIIAVKPVYSKLGPRLKDKVKEVIMRLLNITPSEVESKLTKDGYVEIELGSGEKVKLESDDIQFNKVFSSKGKEVASLKAGELQVIVEK